MLEDVDFYQLFAERRNSIRVDTLCGRGWKGTKPGCVRAKSEGKPQAAKNQKAKLKKESTKLKKTVKPAGDSEPEPAKYKPKNDWRDKRGSLADIGYLSAIYADQIKGQGEPDAALVKSFKDGDRNWNPAMVVVKDKNHTTDEMEYEAIGGNSKKIVASAANSGQNGRPYTVIVPDDPKEIEAAKALQVLDSNPFKMSKNPRIQGFSDVGNLQYQYRDEIKSPQGKGHGASDEQVKAAANLLLKNNARQWVPVLVQKQSDGSTKIVGNHFAHDVVKAAGIERMWTVEVPPDDKPETTAKKKRRKDSDDDFYSLLRSRTMHIRRMDALAKGATKVRNGKKYVLNENSRWVNPDQEKQKIATKQKQATLEKGLNKAGRSQLEQLKTAMGGGANVKKQPKGNIAISPHPDPFSDAGQKERLKRASAIASLENKLENGRFAYKSSDPDRMRSGKNGALSALRDAKNPKVGLAATKNEKGEYTGFLSYKVGSKSVEISQLGTDQSEKGIGRSLFNQVLQEAAKKGLGLDVASVEDAGEFYKKMGMTEGDGGDFDMSAEAVKKAAKTNR